MATKGGRLNGKKPTYLELFKPTLTLFFGELIGTLILVFVGCSSCMDFDGDPVIPHHLKSLGFGFAVLLAMQVCAHITACHINPAVSLVSLLLRRTTLPQFFVYIIAQFSGSFIGFGLLKLLYPEKYTANGFCMTKVAPGTTVIQAFFVEVVITCFLCFVLCSVWDQRNASQTDSIAIRFAFIIGVISATAGPLTGASMNTARSFGPAIFGSSSDWRDQWVYWTAPNLSPFITVPLYKLLFAVPEVKIEDNQTEENARLPS